VPLEVDVGDAEVSFYAENGYLAVSRVTTDEELDWLREVYDQLLAMPPTGYLDGIFDLSRPYGTTDTPKLGQLLLPERIVPQIKQTVMWRNAHRIASRLLHMPQAKVESWGHLIFKGANSQAETPWHQDEAYWDVTKDYNALGSWLALDRVDTDNGCLWFVPKSHRGDVLPHMHGGDDPTIHVLQFSEPVDTSAGVPVPLAAGGMTFHDRVRRAWANEFQTTPVLRDKPKHYPWWEQGKKVLAELERRR
jgi:hypothetical protein